MQKHTIFQMTLTFFFWSAILVAESNIDRAISLFNNQRYEEARELFEKELERNNNSAEVHHYLGRTYLIIGNQEKAGYKAAGNRPEAINAYRKASELNPSAKRTKKKLEALEG